MAMPSVAATVCRSYIEKYNECAAAVQSVSQSEEERHVLQSDVAPNANGLPSQFKKELPSNSTEKKNCLLILSVRDSPFFFLAMIMKEKSIGKNLDNIKWRLPRVAKSTTSAFI